MKPRNKIAAGSGGGAPAHDRMINDQDKYGPDSSHHDARQVHPGNTDVAKSSEDHVPDNSSKNPENDITHQPFPCPIHHFAADEAGYEPDDHHYRMPMMKPPVLECVFDYLEA